MRWLVTGGAGYIGSHVLRSLLAAGHDAVVIDNLSNGNRRRVPATIRFIDGDIRDGDVLLDAMEDTEGVIHLAGLKSVSESFEKPLAYYDNNVTGTLSVLRAMRYRNVGRILLSSTASLYAPSDLPIKEINATHLSSPYAASKFMAERLVADNARATGADYAILRYFNVAGASEPDLRDESDDNLLPRLTRALRDGKAPEIFGDDYPTRDGTCVRDYVHVQDIADAHVLVAERLGQLNERIYNVGAGRGVTVREMISAASAAAGKGLPPLVLDRRPGDSACTIADVTRLEEELGFRAKLGIEDIVGCVKN